MKMSTTVRLTTLALFACLSNTPAAYAATTTTTFNVTANVTATCSVSAGALAFGAYAGDAVPGTSTVTATCTSTTPYHVRLDKGLYGSSVTTRAMHDGSSNPLLYGLYRDSGHTLNWGETDSTDTSDGTGSGTGQAITVYGLIPANQNPPVGDYSDTITVTLSY
jgi:spore coat protein U-like protein